jgi:hypothetical protein
MKPTTKLHHEVYAISQKLSPISESQKALAYKNIFSSYATTKYKTLICLECSHSWKNAKQFENGFKPSSGTCPNCKAKINFLPPSNYLYKANYFTSIEAKENFQIVRIFYVEKHMTKFETPQYSTYEVMQHFIGTNGRMTSLSMAVHGMSMYYDNWNRHSELSIKENNFHTTNRGKIQSDFILPKSTLLKEVTRNGFNGNYYDMAPQNMFSLLMKPQAETLLKCGYIKLFKDFNSREEQIKKYWNSIKICIRNNYKIDNVTTWLDYVKLLDEFGKDLSSTKYVCPADLNKEHDKLVDKKRRIQDKLNAEELQRKLKDQEKAYKKAKKQFFGISFSNGIITIKVLSSVQEFINEGKALRHCIYTNEYFEKKNSLLLSARIDNKPIETIELSLKEMKIVQARGLQNKATKYNKEIKELVMQNITQIQKITNLKSA